MNNGAGIDTFSIFRRYQKIAMVIILLLIMVTFTIGDALMQMSGNLPLVLIVVMTAMIGAALGALLGIQTGKPSEYSIAGVVIGVVVALVGANLSGPAAAVETTAGDLSVNELNSLIDRRRTANGFVAAVYQRVSPPSPQPIPILQQFWQRQLISTQFSNGLHNPADDSPDSRMRLQDDVVLGYLLDREADEMGIEVSDEAVNSFIQSIGAMSLTGAPQKLTRDDFKDIRSKMRVSESNLYDAIRGELRVRMALRHLAPDLSPSPEDYWRIFKQLNVRQRLDVAAVPVEAMAKEVRDPEPAEVAAFFEQYKNYFPGVVAPDSPGFLQPRKVSVAYIEAKLEEFEKQVAEVTPEEIEKHYQDNKEAYKNNPFPDQGDGKSGGKSTDDPLNPEFNPEGPALTPGTAPAGDATKSETVPEAAPEDGSNPPQDAEKKAPAEEPASNPAPDEGEKAKEEGAALEPRSDFADGELLALYQPADNKAPSTPAADAAKTDAGTPAASSEPAKTAEPAESPATPAAEQKDGDAPVEAPKPGDRQAAPEYKPLDDALREQIREELLQTRATTAMKQ